MKKKLHKHIGLITWKSKNKYNKTGEGMGSGILISNHKFYQIYSIRLKNAKSYKGLGLMMCSIGNFDEGIKFYR